MQRLEDGERLGEGKESKIEAALGWEIGSLDNIRHSGKPIVAMRQRSKPLADWTTPEAMEEAERIAREQGDAAGLRFMRRWSDAVKGGQTNTEVTHDAT